MNLEPYKAASLTIKRKLKHLKQLFADEPEQQRRFNYLKSLIAQRLRLLKQSLNLRGQKEFNVSVQIALFNDRKANHAQIRALIAEIENENWQALQQRTKRYVLQASGTIVFLLTGLSLSLAVFVLMYYRLNRQIAERKQAEAKVQDLNNNVPYGHYYLDKDGKFIAINNANDRLQHELFEQERTQKFFQEQARLLDLAPDKLRTRDSDNTEFWNWRAEERYSWSQLEVSGRKFHTFVQTQFPQPLTECDQVEQQAQLIAILEATSDIVVTTSVEQRVCYLNSAARKIFGFGENDDFANFTIADAQPQWAYEIVSQIGIPVAMRDGVWVGETAFLSHDGREIPVSQLLIAHKSSDGDIKLISTIARDITQQKQLEATLREAERRWRNLLQMKDEFISVVSHELRTPLTSIHGALDLLSSGLVDTQSGQGQRVIEIAVESSESLVRLVNDILDLECLELGKISLLKQTCNATDLMMKATDMMQIMANRAGIAISVSPQAIQLDADPDRIIQVLTNLLSNAIKFSPSGSTVWLSVELPISSVLFKVQDQGRGIPVDKTESIFERFHQVDASDAHKEGGKGLGLAICRSIVRQHGGQIWVESTLCEGSSFYFTLPV